MELGFVFEVNGVVFVVGLVVLNWLVGTAVSGIGLVSVRVIVVVVVDVLSMVVVVVVFVVLVVIVS